MSMSCDADEMIGFERWQTRFLILATRHATGPTPAGGGGGGTSGHCRPELRYGQGATASSKLSIGGVKPRRYKTKCTIERKVNGGHSCM